MSSSIRCIFVCSHSKPVKLEIIIIIIIYKFSPCFVITTTNGNNNSESVGYKLSSINYTGDYANLFPHKILVCFPILSLHFKQF